MDIQEILDPMTNPVTYAAPFFILTILIELAALKWLDHDDNVTGYAFKDARASISMGVGSLFWTVGLVIAVGLIAQTGAGYNRDR